MYSPHQKAFTLIELLVVISIIGVLAMAVMAGLNQARVNARNAATLQTISEYRKALELARNSSHDNTYPRPAGAIDNYYCLGHAPDGSACVGVYPEDAAINNILDDYLPSLPSPNPTPIDFGGTAYSGSLYRCIDNCEGYQIQYMLDGIDADCGPGIKIFSAGSGTYCRVEE
jgi:prepilin-type N-terminal cleavage/methylation domain-containing protein